MLELIPEGRLSDKEEHQLSLRNPWQKWHQLFSTLFEKLSHLGAIQWTLKRKNKQYSDQLRGKERWLNKESVNEGQCGSKKDNQWTSTFRSHRGQYCSKTFHDLVNSSSNWKQYCIWGTTSYFHLGVIFWNMVLTNVIIYLLLNEWRKDAHHQDWLWNNATLEGQSHIVILWNMVIDRCYHTTTLNECRKGHPPRRLIVGQFVLKPKGALHRMSMCNKNNIIDEAETFLFTIWLDELRRIYWEEH